MSKKNPHQVEQEYLQVRSELDEIASILFKAARAYNTPQGKKNQTGKVKMALRRLIIIDMQMRNGRGRSEGRVFK